MIGFVRDFVWHGRIDGPVLEIGSYIEANQEHLDMRRAFGAGTKYVGVDVLDGPGVDRKASVLDAGAMAAICDEVAPRVILCLYVLEHVWEIVQAAKVVCDLWKRCPEAWLWVATHQNQPYHGTDKYGDYWRMTASGLGRLMDECGIPDPKIFVLADTSNPSDVLAVRQPLALPWPDDVVGQVLTATSPPHWEKYR